MTSRPVIAARGVRVRYGQTDALDGVDLTVHPGERVALIGPSGAGKSTLLGVLAGSVRPTAGSLDVLGSDPGRMGVRDLRRLRRRIGTVHQRLDLVGPLRVVHNVNAGRLGSWSLGRSLWSLVRPSGRDEVVTALDALELGRHLHARTDELSGGEQQRVAVARVLVQRPDLVLADEPVSSLDPALSARVMALVCGPPAGAPWATVVSLHEPELARRHCDRLVGLREGRVVFDRPSSEVDERLLADLYGLQPR